MESLRGFWKTLKQARHQMPRPKFCPRCRGHKIYPNPTMGIFPATYCCRDCGYQGPLVLEIDSEEGKEPL